MVLKRLQSTSCSAVVDKTARSSTTVLDSRSFLGPALMPLTNLPMYRPKLAPAPTRLSQELGWAMEITFLVCVCFIFLMGQSPAWQSLVDNISINFLAVMVEALPFMLVGSLAGGLIEVFVPISLVDTLFRKRPIRAIFLAGALGLIVPVCECAIVPVVRRLLGKGIPLGAAITFLLAGPIVNPIVGWSTAVAYSYNWQVVAVRLGCGYAIAVCLGLLLGRLFSQQDLVPALADPTLPASCACGESHDQDGNPLLTRLRHAIHHAGNDFFAVGRYLVIGAFIAAILRSSVSLEGFTSLMASPWLAIIIMMLMAFILNLCSEADAFIAASFRDLLPSSAQMAFMVLGPMLDIKLILMYLSVFRKKAILTLCLITPAAVFLTMLGLEFFMPNFIVR